jgi:N-acetylglucosamine-6-phosphate deacetylase
MITALINSTIHTGTQVVHNQAVTVKNGKIKSIQKEIPTDAKIIDLTGYHLSAGLIETHINGGEKYYFTQKPTEETIDDIYEAGLKTGTTHTMPCLITSPLENILKGIEATKNYMAKHQNGVYGMHLEGPFLNLEKRGAHLAKYVRKPTNPELEEIIKYGKGVIKL